MIFRKSKLLNMKFMLKFVWNIPHTKKNWETDDKKKWISLLVKYVLFLSDFNNFLADFWKIK